MSLPYIINIFISNITFLQLTDNTGVRIPQKDGSQHFHGVGYIDVFEDVSLDRIDTEESMVVTIAVLVLNYACTKNRAIYGIILSDERNIREFKELKYHVETVVYNASGNVPTYNIVADRSNLYFQGKGSSQQHTILSLLNENKLRIPKKLIDSLKDAFLLPPEKEDH